MLMLNATLVVLTSGALAKRRLFVYTLVCNACFNKLRNKCYTREKYDDKLNRKNW